MIKVIGIIGFAVLGGVFLMAGCTEGPEGPAGPSGTTNCVQCHNDGSEIPAISGQWAASVHATGGNFERNGEDCALCHTNEGFQHFIDTGEASSPMNPSAIGCFTCHEPHSNGDFSLRVATALDLRVGGTFDYASGNLCANCHQAWVPDPPIDGDVVTDDIRWGPHHGPQANILSGDVGYLADGYDWDTSSAHTGIDDGCIQCHMAAPYGVQAGGHTFKLSYEYHGHDAPLVTGCNTTGCHGDVTDEVEDFDYGGVQTEVEGLLADLKTALMGAGILDADDYLAIPDEPEDATITLTENEAAAVYYYQLVREDRSMGVHNPDFVLDMLNNALDLLD